MAGENGSKSEERKPTERIVLRRVVALSIPDGATEEQVQAAVAALYPKARKAEVAGAVGEAWQEVARHTASTKIAAIEAYAGKPGTPDAKVGVFRAPTVTSWKDAAVYDAPPLPLVERSVIE